MTFITFVPTELGLSVKRQYRTVLTRVGVYGEIWLSLKYTVD